MSVEPGLFSTFEMAPLEVRLLLSFSHAKGFAHLHTYSYFRPAARLRYPPRTRAMIRSSTIAFVAPWNPSHAV